MKKQKIDLKTLAGAERDFFITILIQNARDVLRTELEKQTRKELPIRLHEVDAFAAAALYFAFERYWGMEETMNALVHYLESIGNTLGSLTGVQKDYGLEMVESFRTYLGEVGIREEGLTDADHTFARRVFPHRRLKTEDWMVKVIAGFREMLDS